MNADQRQEIRDHITHRAGAGTIERIDRRRLLQLAGGLGVALAGGGMLFTAADSASGRSGSVSLRAMQQTGTPVAAATPQVGMQANGTHLWKVQVGAMDMENMIDIQAMLPAEITINAGDAIWFEFGMMPGFHTVTFTSGEEPPTIFMPDSDATPAAGPPTLMLNPNVIFPSGGDSYDGTGLVNSGLDIFRDATTPPFVLTFTKPGTYDYQCIPHQAVMKATVIVRDAGADLPHDQAAYDQMAKERIGALIGEGMAAAEEHAEATSTKRADGTTLWELSAGVGGKSQARVFRMLPDAIEVGMGDTIRWVNRSVGEPHTVTFLGGEEPPEDTLIEPQPAGPPKLIQNNLTLLPQGGDVFSGTGYHNSGFIGTDFPGGESFTLTFDTSGEFSYYCILHGGADGTGMSATVTVTASP